MDKTSRPLTAQQISDADFLKRLALMLRDKDLSKLDLVTTGNEHKTHSLLVEIYEINVRRTPVYAYPTRWNRIFCWGKWVFEPGKYERYELNISENIHNKRQCDYMQEYSIDKNLGNPIIQIGTMATGAGYFPATSLFINRNSEIYEDLCTKQNAHLFAPTRELYNILDQEHERRRQDYRLYVLPELKDEAAKRSMRRRLLENLQRKL